MKAIDDNEIQLEKMQPWQKDVMERVENGVRFLDDEQPHWYYNVDPILLDMSDGGACICGQVFEDMSEKQGFNYFQDHYGEKLACSWGFLAQGYEWIDNEGIDRYVTSEQEYSFLAEEWLFTINKKLANDGNLIGDTA